MANWPGTKSMWRPIGAQRDLDQPVVDLAHGLHLVVVQRQEEAREQLAVEVEAQARRRRSRRSSSAGAGASSKRRPVEHAVHEAGGDEQPGRAVQRPPALVAAEDPARVAHARCVARGDHEARAAAAAPPTASAAGSPTTRARPCRSPRWRRAARRARCRSGWRPAGCAAPAGPGRRSRRGDARSRRGRSRRTTPRPTAAC